MIRMRTLTQSAKLRTKTQLRPVIRQGVEVDRYFKLLELMDASDDDLADLMPSPACNRRLRALLPDLKKVESVSKAIQGEDVSLLDARVWLDGLISIKPYYARFIGPRAEIVHSPDFEAGCVRLLPGNANRLTCGEKAPLSPFRRQGRLLSVRMRMKKKARLSSRSKYVDKVTRYDLLYIIPAAFNVVERFCFSVARTAFGQERLGLLPITLAKIIFLRVNGACWDARNS
ncbi:hypothetical protein PC110_g18295 [Phytophthora cactorum]|uniref:Uncharacterized protein n=1 Tax=Phytophthora cactorum TaxID=29920 RepID=A0A329RQ52_9STRA|nr:hypothetical protein PC110_g18295 [Phytophthora cactorum]